MVVVFRRVDDGGFFSSAGQAVGDHRGDTVGATRGEEIHRRQAGADLRRLSHRGAKGLVVFRIRRVEQFDVVDSLCFDSVGPSNVDVVRSTIGPNGVDQGSINFCNGDPRESAALKGLLGEQAALDRPESETHENVIGHLTARLS